MTMQFEHAEHTLETIRTLMERSQRYEHISGYSGLVAGSAVLVGWAVLEWATLPFEPRVSFAVVWSTVFLFAFCCHCVLTFARARQRGEPVWSRQARTVLQAVLPGFVASVAVSVLMWRLGRLNLLPGFWLLFYGCSALATSFFAPKSIRALGAVCLALGVAGLVVAPDRPGLTMAVGFGLTHIVFGACVLVTEWREERERAFWKTLEQA